MYPEQLRIADILNDLGVATQEAGKFDESLRHYQEAKEILVNNGRNSHFSCTKEHWKKLFGTYTVPFSFSIFKKALDNLDMTMISGEVYYTVCKEMAKAVMELSVASIIQTMSNNKMHGGS